MTDPLPAVLDPADPTALTKLPGGNLIPALIAAAGETAAWRYIDFFTANIRDCQVKRLQNELALMMSVRRGSSRLLDRRLLSPGPKRFGPSPAIAEGTEAMTPRPEVTVDDGVR